jgi:hypothetical protein
MGLMSLQGMRKELADIKKEYAPYFKTIEELLKTKPEDIRNLTNEELFRVIQFYHPEYKTEDDLKTEILERMAKGEDQ